MSKLDEIRPQHFGWKVEGKVATITLNRPEKKNPLTFASYGELIDTFRRLKRMGDDVRTVVLTGAGGNFCSGGDIHEIIGPLVEMKDKEQGDKLLAFTRMTGGLVIAMRACPQPIIAAVDGICAEQVRFWPWLPICVSAPSARESPSYSSALVSQVPTWERARCCPHHWTRPRQ